MRKIQNGAKYWRINCYNIFRFKELMQILIDFVAAFFMYEDRDEKDYIIKWYSWCW
mgnify:CR=1 FL=1